MTDAIEAGARAIKQLTTDTITNKRCRPSYSDVAKACIASAIASGALVPASAVVEMRERCAKVADDDAEQASEQIRRNNEYCDQIKQPHDTEPNRLCRHREHASRGIARTIRQIDIAPASGDYVVVPREPSDAMVEAGDDALNSSLEDQEKQTKGELVIWSHSQSIYRAMLNAASSNEGEK